jgi:hypothetical protein
MLVLMLSGCSFEGRFEPARQVVVESPPAPELMCQVRARLFHGLVAMPCIDVAREIRP